MKKFYVLNGNDSYSAKRLGEEINDFPYEFISLNFSDLIATDKGLFVNGELLDLQKDDIFWSVNNSTMTHLVLSSINRDEDSFMWPDPCVFDLTNKFQANCFFSKNEIKTPKTVLISTFNYDEIIKNSGMNFPLVLKRNYGSGGGSVFLTKNLEEIDDAIQKMFSRKAKILPMKSATFILQEFIAESQGSDYRVLCLKDEIIGGIKRTAQEGFKANIAIGGTAEKFDVDENLADICRVIMEKSGAFYAGIDFIESDDGWLTIEVNTCAQFKGFEQATGVNVARKIIEKLEELK